MSWVQRLGLPRVRQGWRWVAYDSPRAQALLHHPHGLWVWVSTVYPLQMRDRDHLEFNRGLAQAVRDRLRGRCIPFAERLSDGRERFWLEGERRPFQERLARVAAWAQLGRMP
jgi:hypothetical protein